MRERERVIFFNGPNCKPRKHFIYKLRKMEDNWIKSYNYT